jgi:GTP-binding nuclear protein Ran
MIVWVMALTLLPLLPPYSWLARKLVGNQSLEFVAAPALAPPEVQVDQALLDQYAREMNDAAQMPLPEEDDNDL